jgi:arabinogalactan endo-1,4-beta-galactosidase
MNRREFLIALGSTALAAGVARAAAPAPGPFLAGADVSLLQKIEDLGGVFKEAGKLRDLLAILKDHGATCMRLRLFHSPDGKGPVCNDLAYTLKLARRIKTAGLRLLLDIHYSDTWADPAHQATPKAWQGLAPAKLEDAVFAYTRDTLAAMKAADALPEIVQVGNEITPGFLWDAGRVGGKFDTPEQWQRLGALVRAGLGGVREAGGAAVRTMIHIDPGGSAAVTRWFFDHLAAEKADFDLLGLSYYPWWHGSFDDLRGNLATVAARFKKDIVVVETAYPWTRERGNFFNADPAKLKTPYPPTPEGQRDFLVELLKIVRATPDSRGHGLLYWAPEWIAVKGMDSPYQNLTLFDFEGNALPGIKAFEG